MPVFATTAVKGPLRSRIGASRLRPTAGMWSTTHSATGRSASSVSTMWRSPSTPPADAAIPTTRCGRSPSRRSGCTSIKGSAYAVPRRCVILPEGLQGRAPRTVTAVPPKRVEVAIGDKTLSLSNLDKVLYPRAGFTKGQVIDYYTRIAPALLRHLHARPLTLKRYPNGVEGKFFYEKRCPPHAPDWVKKAAVWSGRNEGDIP